MEMKKKYAIILLGTVVFVGILLGVIQFGKTKKVVSVSMLESGKETNDIENEQVKNSNQSPVLPQAYPREISNQEEETVIDESEKNKKEEKIAEPVTQEKEVEKKTIESERQVPMETKSETGKIVDRLVSWGYAKSSERKIDTVIIHSSYDALGNDPYSVSGIIEIYKQYEVSAHYLIDRGGVIYRLVADQNVAWHAGVAKMPDGRTDVNSFSIGIEMISTLDGEYTDDQYDAVNSLLASLKKKYEIRDILGHNEIAPGRKTDPWGINWDRVRK